MSNPPALVVVDVREPSPVNGGACDPTVSEVCRRLDDDCNRNQGLIRWS